MSGKAHRIFQSIEAEQERWESAIEIALQEGAINEPNEQSGSTLLHLAAMRIEQTWVEKLLKLGADPLTINQREETPLMVAIKYGGVQEITALIQRGGAGAWRNSNGDGPVSVAIEKSREQALMMLIENGVKIRALEERGSQSEAAHLARKMALSQEGWERALQALDRWDEKVARMMMKGLVERAAYYDDEDQVEKGLSAIEKRLEPEWLEPLGQATMQALEETPHFSSKGVRASHLIRQRLALWEARGLEAESEKNRAIMDRGAVIKRI